MSLVMCSDLAIRSDRPQVRGKTDDRGGVASLSFDRGTPSERRARFPPRAGWDVA